MKISFHHSKRSLNDIKTNGFKNEKKVEFFRKTFSCENHLTPSHKYIFLIAFAPTVIDFIRIISND